MDILSADLISYIGQFLPFEDRKNCGMTCKPLSCINYSYEAHRITMKNIPREITLDHLRFIKRIKPKIKTNT